MIDKENLQSQAFSKLSRRIVHSIYVPGQKISEKNLEADLQMGRTPIREALIRLRRDGLIETIPQSGTYVSKINLQAAISARFVRESIERHVMIQAAAKIQVADAASIEEIIAEQKQVSQEKDLDQFFDLDEHFHQSFYQISGQTDAWVWLQTINAQLNRFRWLRLKVSRLNWEPLIVAHTKLFRAVQEHNPSEAERLCINHLHLMLDEEQVLLKTFPDYFTE